MASMAFQASSARAFGFQPKLAAGIAVDTLFDNPTAARIIHLVAFDTTRLDLYGRYLEVRSGRRGIALGFLAAFSPGAGQLECRPNCARSSIWTEHLTTDQKVGGSSPSERAQTTWSGPRVE